MILLRRVARPMLASTFVLTGLAALARPESSAEVSEQPARRLSAGTARLPDLGPSAAVRVNAGIMVGAGTLLALSRAPRLAALALIATAGPATIERARATQGEAGQRPDRRRELLRGVGLVGGLLLAAVDADGRPSLGWRVHHAADQAGTRTGRARRVARRQARRSRREAKLTGRVVKARAGR